MTPAPLPEVILYTDGACSGNPGPGGWGAILTFQGVEKTLSGGDPSTTNNRMELQAVIEGLKRLTKPCRVNVHSDSAYVVNAFKLGWLTNWQKKGWKNAAGSKVANRELWEALLALTAQHDVTFTKVKGHADDEMNNRVDALAVEACQRYK